MVQEFFACPVPSSLLILLVNDQKSLPDSIRQMCRSIPEIELYHCNNLENAVAVAKQIVPTVILLELSSCHKEGLRLIRSLREEVTTRDIPLIIFSPKKDAAFKADAFAEGANDYWLEMPDKVEFIARIRYHSGAYLRLLQRNQAFEHLDQSQKILETALSEAAAYVTSMLPEPLDGDIKTSWRFSPSMHLGGDALGYHWIDEENFAFYLLDVCGHGVGAALLSISVANVLRSQTLPNTDFLQPVQVLEALNENFPMEKHNNMFLTIWYGVYNKRARTLTYASGGHPPAVLISDDNKTVKELSTHGLVIGALPATKMHSSVYTINKGDRLYLFSDGIYELQDANEDHLQWEEFIDVLRKDTIPGLDNVERILEFSRSFVGNRAFVDDVSILEIIFR